VVTVLFANRKSNGLLLLRALCGLAGVLSLCGCRMWSNSQNCGGVTYYQQGQYQQAAASFQQALATDPTNPDAYYNLAASYHQLAKQSGDQNAWREAERLYNLGLDYAPDHVESYRGLAVLLKETNRQDKAFTLLNNWASSRPQLADARVELARLYEETGDNTKAVTYLSHALQINPNDPRALAALGRMREQSGDVQQALANYQRAYQINPSQPGVAQRLAALQPRSVTTGAPTTNTAPVVTLPNSPTTPRFAAPIPKARY
jgi:Flp pilus assembly protein TadD